MYPAPFEYYRAESVSHAIDLINEHEGEEVELLSGGHSLLPTMKSGLANPDVVIDIGHIDELHGIERNGDSTTIGSLTRYVDISTNEELWSDVTTLAEAASEVADIQVRNMGTIGGNVAHSDPASDLPGAVLAADATITVEGSDGERTIHVDDFFLGMYETSLAEDEVLTGFELPHLGPNDAGAYVKKPSPSSGYAMVGVAVNLQTDGETIESARVAANGAFDHATRLSVVEEHLEGESLDSDGLAEDAAPHATDNIEEWELMEDLQASSEFRGQLLKVYTQRAINKAIERVGESPGHGQPRYVHVPE